MVEKDVEMFLEACGLKGLCMKSSGRGGKLKHRSVNGIIRKTFSD